MRLIDSDALLEFLTNRYEGLEDSTGKWRTYGCYWDAKDAIKDAPTVDAVPVVRCKDCKHFDGEGCCMKIGMIVFDGANWFCKYGERRGKE